jgi:hypothetical protein
MAARHKYPPELKERRYGCSDPSSCAGRSVIGGCAKENSEFRPPMNPSAVSAYLVDYSTRPGDGHDALG